MRYLYLKNIFKHFNKQEQCREFLSSVSCTTIKFFSLLWDNELLKIVTLRVSNTVTEKICFYIPMKTLFVVE